MPGGHDGPIEVLSYTWGSAQVAQDSFIFIDSAMPGRGGVVVACGDVDVGRPQHTPDWFIPRPGDPAGTPHPDDQPGVQTGSWVFDITLEGGSIPT